MARKITITKEFIVNTAFLMAKQEGIEQVTARKLAAKAECSTQPIFRLYNNMEELSLDAAIAVDAKNANNITRANLKFRIISKL